MKYPVLINYNHFEFEIRTMMPKILIRIQNYTSRRIRAVQDFVKFGGNSVQIYGIGIISRWIVLDLDFEFSSIIYISKVSLI